MSDGSFQLGQIWRRNQRHGLLLAVSLHEFLNGCDNIYTVFIFERGDIVEWTETYMIHDIKYKKMELIA